MAVTFTRKVKTFVDISLDFTPHPLTGDITTIKDTRSVNNSIKNLLLIMPNEVPFQRDIGSTTASLLFDMCDEATASTLESEIRRTILFNEPRVEIEKIVVEPYPEQNEFRVTVKYKIVGTLEVITFEHVLYPTR